MPAHNQAGDEAAAHDPAVVSVLVVEPHALLRQAFAAVLRGDPRLQLVGAEAELPAALRAAARTRPHVVLLGQGASWIGLRASVRALRQRGARTAVVVTGADDAAGYDAAARRAGADGYLAADAAADVLLDAVATAARGG